MPTKTKTVRAPGWVLGADELYRITLTYADHTKGVHTFLRAGAEVIYGDVRSSYPAKEWVIAPWFFGMAWWDKEVRDFVHWERKFIKHYNAAADNGATDEQLDELGDSYLLAEPVFPGRWKVSE